MLVHTTRCVCALAALLAAGGTCAAAALIDVIVSRASGNVTFVNSGAVAAPITGYSIFSGSNSLRPANWLSVADNYDASSSRLVDVDDNWTIISAASNSLAEGDFNGDGGAITPGQPISLGAIWNPLGSQDLQVTLNDIVSPSVEYRLVGDYNGNGIVDAADYTVWRDRLGGGSLLNREPLLTGAIGQPDYAIWAANFGISIGGAAAAVAASSIPEPTSLALLALVLTSIAATSGRGLKARAESPAR